LIASSLRVVDSCSNGRIGLDGNGSSRIALLGVETSRKPVDRVKRSRIVGGGINYTSRNAVDGVKMSRIVRGGIYDQVGQTPIGLGGGRKGTDWTAPNVWS
jgi:hypothetical protein